MQALLSLQQPVMDFPAALFLPPVPQPMSHPHPSYQATFLSTNVNMQPKRAPHPPHDFPCADCWKR